MKTFIIALAAASFVWWIAGTDPRLAFFVLTLSVFLAIVPMDENIRNHARFLDRIFSRLGIRIDEE